MSRVIKVAVLLAASFAPLQAESQSYYCEAQGVYTVCVTERGVETCEDHVATGGAASGSRSGAETLAIQDCTTNQTSAVQRGNWPTGSDSRSQRVFSKDSCRVTNCKDGGGGQPSVPGGASGTSFDQLMALGDQYSANGDLNSAIMLWDQASRMSPTREEPYLRADLALLRAGRYVDACNIVDRGVQQAGATTSMQLAVAECAVYRGQFDQAEQSAISLMETEANADARLAANLIGWISSSLKNGALVPCGGLASTLAQRSSTPGWDLSPMVGYLGSVQVAGASQVAALVVRLQSNGVASASDFQAACGQ